MSQRNRSRCNLTGVRSALAALMMVVGCAGVAQAATVIADFESGAAPGWGALTNSGVQPWQAPVSGQVATGTIGSLSGSKVLDVTGSPAFNFGQSDGAAVGFDFLSQNLRSAFLANDRIEFDWLAAPDAAATSGYSQIFNVILNTQAVGSQNVLSYNGSNNTPPELNQYYFTGYNGTVQHVVVDYSAYKNAVLASANPDGGGWLQLGLQLNAGGGAPAHMQFDNFVFSQVPEPSSLALVGVGVIGLLRRRRTA